MLPKARTALLVIQELAEETLVFDQARQKAHCLNRTTSLVWRHCDGRTPVYDLARWIERELAIASGEPVVRLALEQLASRHLLEGIIDRGSAAQRRYRRELLKQMAAAAVVLPIILTVAAPRANAAGSQVSCTGKVDGTGCGTGLICCGGRCSSGQFICNGACCAASKVCSGQPCGSGSDCCSGSCTGPSSTCA
jgi:hypothetical protein